MRKIGIFLISIMVSAFLNAQTFVSTEPSNKNVLIEEFTGVICTWCPAGHKIANDIVHDNPGRAFCLNVHQGGQANVTPDYRTEFGDALASEFSVSAYPTAAINRHVFSGSSVEVVDRANWPMYSNQIFGQSSYANIAAKSEIDVLTRELTVNVEIYYTANAPVESNNINVALLQNNVTGPQYGMGQNLEQVIEDKYHHMHMLRHFLTGQWGDVITTTTQGTFVSKTYTYTIPSDLRDIEIDLSELEVLVYIAQGRREVITCARSEMKYVSTNPVIMDIKVLETYSLEPDIMISATVFNFTQEEVTDLQFTCKFNAEPEKIYNCAKIMEPLLSSTIPKIKVTDTVNFVIPIISGEKFTVTVDITGYNEGKEVFVSSPNVINDKKTIMNVEGEHQQFVFILGTDRWGSETSFAFMDSDGNIIRKDGPFEDLTTDRVTPRQYILDTPKSGIYKLEVYDTGGNGVNSGNGAGYIRFMDIEGEIIFYDDGKFGYQANYLLNITAPDVSINKNTLSDGIILYPNPVKDKLRITMGSSATLIDRPLREVEVELFDVFGRKQNNCQFLIVNSPLVIDVSHLSAGVYLIKIKTENGFDVKRFIKK